MTSTDSVVLPSGQSDLGLLKRLSTIQVACLAMVVLISTIVLCAWLSTTVAARLPNGWSLMKFDTALGLFFGAVSLAASPVDGNTLRFWGGRALALLIAAIAGIALFEHASGRLTGIDTWFASDGTSDKPGLMASQTSIYLLLLSVWLLSAGTQEKSLERAADVITALLVLLTLIIVSGYCFDAVELFGQSMSTRTSPHTLLCMVLLTVVLVGRRTRHGYFAVFVGVGIGSQLARRSLPVALLLPFFLMLTGAYLARHGWLSASVAAGLTVTAIAATLAALVSLMGRKINHLEHSLQEMSLIDELTGVYNYRGFMLLGEQAMREAERSNLPLTILAIDLDDLKYVNDQFGHNVGSQFVLDVAKLLRENFEGADILARVGGDEFVVITKGKEMESILALTRIGEIADAMNADGKRPYRISFSVGEAVGDPASKESLSDLVAKADHMMYARKRARRSAESAAAPQKASA
jgi:diguanylate cyclase (GGDEF)-like protein